jgi:hypothetical protein
MKIELIRGTVIAGEGKDAGAIVDVSESLASMLIASGKGIPAVEKPAKVDRSVALETSSAPKPKTRKAE